VQSKPGRIWSVGGWVIKTNAEMSADPAKLPDSERPPVPVASAGAQFRCSDRCRAALPREVGKTVGLLARDRASSRRPSVAPRSLCATRGPHAGKKTSGAKNNRSLCGEAQRHDRYPRSARCLGDSGLPQTLVRVRRQPAATTVPTSPSPSPAVVRRAERILQR
jgi:hypothetical protein